MSAIRCVCNNWLGVLHPDGRIEVRHRGRKLIGRLDEIVCEHCGGIWRANTGSLLAQAAASPSIGSINS
jgi:hypothetical protein